MGDAPEEVKRRHIENCTKADPTYGAGVAWQVTATTGTEEQAQGLFLDYYEKQAYNHTVNSTIR